MPHTARAPAADPRATTMQAAAIAAALDTPRRRALHFLAAAVSSAQRASTERAPSSAAMQPGADGVRAASDAFYAALAWVCNGGGLTLKDPVIQVVGDLAVEVGTEDGAITLGDERTPISTRATNIYQREDGAWKLVHHHTDLAADLVAALRAMDAR